MTDRFDAPLYNGCQPPPLCPADGHRGLWFNRFFDEFSSDFKELKNKEKSKRDWLARCVANPAGDADQLRRHRQRQQQLALALGGQVRAFRTVGRFATGLGYPHPVENSLTWHPTLGVPYLPGAGVKGLLRAWCEHWSEGSDVEAWFGKGAGDGGDGHAGGLVFFDALPDAPTKLELDVMTPHLGDWYARGGEIRDIAKDYDKLPADWHDPVPIRFLTVADCTTFQFAIAPRSPEHAALVAEVFDLLTDALDWLGAGAKTAVGYGRMRPAK